MPHQTPKEPQRDSFSYGLTHETGYLIRELAATEARKLGLAYLSPADYLTLLVKREAHEQLDEQSLQEARQHHEERTAARLRSLEERKARKQQQLAS